MHHAIIHVPVMPFVQVLQPAQHHLIVPIDVGLVFYAGAEVGLDQSVLLDVVQIHREVNWLEVLDAAMVRWSGYLARNVEVGTGEVLVGRRRTQKALVVTDPARVALATDIERYSL